MIFAQPFCENAHIVTLDSSSCNHIAVRPCWALLHFQICFKQLAINTFRRTLPCIPLSYRNSALPTVLSVSEGLKAAKAGIPGMNLFPLS